jgi:hypothetical protein
LSHPNHLSPSREDSDGGGARTRDNALSRPEVPLLVQSDCEESNEEHHLATAARASFVRKRRNKNVTSNVQDAADFCVVQGDFTIFQFCQKNDSEKLG